MLSLRPTSSVGGSHAHFSTYSSLCTCWPQLRRPLALFTKLSSLFLSCSIISLRCGSVGLAPSKTKWRQCTRIILYSNLKPWQYTDNAIDVCLSKTFPNAAVRDNNRFPQNHASIQRGSVRGGASGARAPLNFQKFPKGGTQFVENIEILCFSMDFCGFGNHSIKIATGVNFDND